MERKDKNISDTGPLQSDEATMSQEECEQRAAEKGFGECGAHRCDQSGSAGTELHDSKSREWIEKQQQFGGRQQDD